MTSRVEQQAGLAFELDIDRLHDGGDMRRAVEFLAYVGRAVRGLDSSHACYPALSAIEAQAKARAIQLVQAYGTAP